MRGIVLLLLCPLFALADEQPPAGESPTPPSGAAADPAPSASANLGELRLKREVFYERCQASLTEGEPLVSSDKEALRTLLTDLREASDGASSVRSLYWRGLLSLCVAEEEAGIADLQAVLRGLKSERVSSISGPSVRRILAAQGVLVDVDGEPYPFARSRRLTHWERPRGEFFVGGGMVLGGTTSSSVAYAGLDVLPRDMDENFGSDGVWWAGNTSPEASTWAETVPTFGVVGGGILGLRVWSKRRIAGRGAQFGFGFLMGLRNERADTEFWHGEAEIDCDARGGAGNCVNSDWVGARDLDPLDQAATYRFARALVGPEFSFRFAPESMVTPVLHVVAPAIDLPLSWPNLYCNTATASGSGEEWFYWDNVEFSGWEEETDETNAQLNQTPSPVFGQWDTQSQSQGDDPSGETKACVATGPGAPYITARLGVSLEVRPLPFLAFAARIDAQPILYGGAVGIVDSFPDSAEYDFDEEVFLGVHKSADDVVPTRAGQRVPVLVVGNLTAAVSF